MGGLISYRHNFIFVHIPKCAGTAVEDHFSALEGDFDPCELLLPGKPCPELREHALPFEVGRRFQRDIEYFGYEFGGAG